MYYKHPASCLPHSSTSNIHPEPHLYSPGQSFHHHHSDSDPAYIATFAQSPTRTYHDLYNRNSIAFYRKLEQAFIGKGYIFTNEKIRKKLGNMLTPKRAKDRSRTTGKGKITWAYYSVSSSSVYTSKFIHLYTKTMYI